MPSRGVPRSSCPRASAAPGGASRGARPRRDASHHRGRSPHRALRRPAPSGTCRLDELVAAGLHGVSEDAGADARAVREREYTHGPSRSSYFFGCAGMTTRTVLLVSAAAARVAERQVTPNVGVHVVVPAEIVPRVLRKTIWRFAVWRSAACRGTCRTARQRDERGGQPRRGAAVEPQRRRRAGRVSTLPRSASVATPRSSLTVGLAERDRARERDHRLRSTVPAAFGGRCPGCTASRARASAARRCRRS